MMQVDENVVFVGRKPVAFYVGAVFTLFAQGHNTVEIKARGQNIYNAVRTALAVKDKLGNVEFSKIEIYDEEFEQNGKKRKVAAITIVISKT